MLCVPKALSLECCRKAGGGALECRRLSWLTQGCATRYEGNVVGGWRIVEAPIKMQLSVG